MHIDGLAKGVYISSVFSLILFLQLPRVICQLLNVDAAVSLEGEDCTVH